STSGNSSDASPPILTRREWLMPGEPSTRPLLTAGTAETSVRLERIVSARREAELAVRDMQDADLRTKAFEVILSRLLDDEEEVATKSAEKPKSVSVREGKNHSNESIPGRILALKD